MYVCEDAFGTSHPVALLSSGTIAGDSAMWNPDITPSGRVTPQAQHVMFLCSASGPSIKPRKSPKSSLNPTESTRKLKPSRGHL